MIQIEYNKSQYLKSILKNASLIDKSIRDEMEESILENGAFHSFYEAYSVLKEEVEELWNEIKNKENDYDKIYQDSISIASIARNIALCTIYDVYP